MGPFRILLAAIFVPIVLYTGVVVAEHGPGLLTIFFGDIVRMGWRGQFNVDFMGFLLLSGTWLGWRHHFSPAGRVLMFLGFFLGAPFLTAYLFVASFQARGDWAELFLGRQRATARRAPA